MSKAFDNVSHSQFADRLQELGFRGNMLKWFSLSNNIQTVGCHIGVPQGSIAPPQGTVVFAVRK